MKWFGDHWNAPVNESAEHVDHPTDMVCTRCNYGFLPHHRGLIFPGTAPKGVWLPNTDQQYAYHLRCFLIELGMPVPQ